MPVPRALLPCMQMSSNLDLSKINTSFVPDSDTFKTVLKTAGGSFIEHPFIWLAGIGMLFMVCLLFFKQGNDSFETSMQNFAMKAFVGGATFLLTLALLFAMDMGFISMDMILK